MSGDLNDLGGDFESQLAAISQYTEEAAAAAEWEPLGMDPLAEDPLGLGLRPVEPLPEPPLTSEPESGTPPPPSDGFDDSIPPPPVYADEFGIPEMGDTPPPPDYMDTGAPSADAMPVDERSSPMPSVSPSPIIARDSLPARPKHGDSVIVAPTTPTPEPSTSSGGVQRVVTRKEPAVVDTAVVEDEDVKTEDIEWGLPKVRGSEPKPQSDLPKVRASEPPLATSATIASRLPPHSLKTAGDAAKRAKEDEGELVKKASFTALLRQVDVGLEMVETLKEVMRKYGKHQLADATKLLEVLGRYPPQYRKHEGLTELGELCDMCHSLVLETVKSQKVLAEFVSGKLVPRMSKYVHDKRQLAHSVKKSNTQAEAKYTTAVTALKKTETASKTAAVKAKEAISAGGVRGSRARSAVTTSTTTASASGGWRSIGKYMKQMAGTGGDGTQSEADVLYKKARDLDKRHEAAVMTANHEQQVYDHIAVRFKKRCRDLEVDRFNFTKKSVELFLREQMMYFSNPSVHTLMEQMQESVMRLEAQTEVDSFLEMLVRKYGNALEMRRQFKYVRADYQNAFYSLQDAMDISLKLDARHRPEHVPKLMVCLCERIESLGGFRTEGIFRISAATTELLQLRQELSKHNYAYVASLRDTHVPAGMLKMWLREMHDSLIPQSHYDVAIAMAKELPKLTATALEVFLSQLPVVNRESIRFLTTFLQRLLRPENVEVTKMSVENVAIVFAPTILKCPSQDPMILMQNSKYERDFTVRLLTML